MRRKKLDPIDRPWEKDKVAYLVMIAVNDASIVRAKDFVERQLAHLPLNGLTIDRVSSEHELRGEVRALMAKEDQLFGARFIIAPNAVAIVSNHAVGDTSFMFPATRLLRGALDVKVSSSRIALFHAVDALARHIVRHPLSFVRTFFKMFGRARRSVERTDPGAMAGGWSHEYVFIPPEVVQGWRAGKTKDESGNSHVIRNILKSLHSAAQFPSSVRLSVMVDLRRYDRRLRARVGNFVGAVHMPLTVAISEQDNFGRHLRNQLNSAEPLMGCVSATLRETVSSVLPSLSRGSTAAADPEIHVSFTAEPVLGSDHLGVEIFARPKANVLAVRVAIDANGGASASFNSAYRADELRRWVSDLGSTVDSTTSGGQSA